METKDIILEVRKSNGLSQDEMAAKLFVTRQAVSRWENGETTPTLSTLKTIAKEFNVPANKLLNLPAGAECQSCGMPLKKMEDIGTNADATAQTDYCSHCFQKGGFSSDRTVDEMVESNLRFLDEFNADTGNSFTPDEARTVLKAHLATLKRWNKEKI
jgi:DNA-binding XRE family transcriptional regulator